MNDFDELVEALDLLQEVYEYQYCFSIHDKIKEFLIKQGRIKND